MSNIPSPESFIFSDDYVCRWDSCLLSFDDAEVLYDHIKNAHVGRKAQHNLCLTCKWDNCNAAFNKRDHITSHVRVHVDLKPYGCAVCQKVFKRPQDLKKHEKIHTDEELRVARVAQENAENSNGAGASYGVSHSSLFPGVHEQLYQPLSPQSFTDRSPSIASSTVSSLSPYTTPLSPSSMNDPTELWSNPGLASPLSTNSEDLFNSPRISNLEADIMTRPVFGGPMIDISGHFYGQLPVTSSGLENMVSPQSAKRSHDDSFEEILVDTLGSFVVESKKKRVDAPSYDDETAAHLNALSTILGIETVTSGSLASSMPVTNVQEVDQFGNYLNTLFENITGEVYEPQSYQTLFPDVEQKQNAVSLDASFNTNNFVFNPNAIGQGLVSNGGIQQGMYFDNLQDKPLFNPVLSGPFNPQPAWGQTGSAPVIRRGMGVNPMQQHNPTDHPHQYVALPAVMTGNIKKEPLSAGAIKSEPQDSPTIKSEESRTYVHMSTQTKAKQEGVMMMQRPTERKSTKSYENLDPTALLESAPSVPDTPFPEISVKESTVVDQDKDQAKDAPKSPSEETPSSPSATRPATSGKYSDMLQRAKARQAEAAAAAAAKAAEPLDPVEAMTRQLAQTRLDDPKVKFITQPARTKPITEGDMERQMNAAKARALCENDPVRKQHAEVVLNLLQSIDNMMAGHRKKVAVWKAVQSREAGGEAAATAGVTTSPRHASSRGQFSVHNQDQIRTVTSILSSRPTSQTPPLHQDLSKLHSSLADHRPSSYSDMPVMYPNSSSDLQSSADEPFELTEEERRYIEEDNARIAAARETPGYQSVRV